MLYQDGTLSYLLIRSYFCFLFFRSSSLAQSNSPRLITVSVVKFLLDRLKFCLACLLKVIVEVRFFLCSLGGIYWRNGWSNTSLSWLRCSSRRCLNLLSLALSEIILDGVRPFLHHVNLPLHIIVNVFKCDGIFFTSSIRCRTSSISCPPLALSDLGCTWNICVVVKA